MTPPRVPIDDCIASGTLDNYADSLDTKDTRRPALGNQTADTACAGGCTICGAAATHVLAGGPGRPHGAQWLSQRGGWLRRAAGSNAQRVGYGTGPL